MGSRVQNVRTNTGTIINIPRKNDKVNDIIYIRGTKEGVEKAGNMILFTLNA